MNADSFPTFLAWGRFFRRCLRRMRLLFFSKKSLVVYLLIFSLGVLAWFADRWHGRHTWAVEKERLATAGESLDLKAQLTPRPPDAENFFAIPELEPLKLDRSGREPDRLFMWYGKDTVEKRTKQGKAYRGKIFLPRADADSSLAEVCREFRKYGVLPPQPLAANPAEELLLSAVEWEDLLAAMDAASSRPFSVWLPPAAERLETHEQVSLFRVFQLVRSLTLHGLASLEAGKMPAARRDLRIVERLADATQNAGALFIVVAEVIRRTGEQVIRSGARRHQWSEPELGQFIKSRSEEDLSAAWSRGLLTYRAESCRNLEHPPKPLTGMNEGEIAWIRNLRLAVQNFYLKYAPDGPGLRYCAAISRFYSRLASEIRSPAAEETWLERIKKIDTEGYPSIFGPNFTEGTARWYGGPLFNRRLLRGACILEQYFLKNKKYPPTLDAVSAVSPETFTDVDGKPLHYRVNDGGTNFRLWSVGWDGKDDSADPDPRKKGEDWVFSTE